jgi:hypothetical protein
MGRVSVVAAVVFASLLVFGCDDSMGGASGPDGGMSPDGASPDAAGALGFKPSNVDLTGLDLSKVKDITITSTNNFVNGETGTFGFVAADQFVFKAITLSNSNRLGLFVVKSLRVEANSTFSIMGVLPIVIVALDTITIAGSYDARPGLGGGAVLTTPNSKGAGPGGGPGGTATGAMIYAGSGASFCGVGGAGALQGGGTPNSKGTGYGTPDLVPLLAGSSGGSATSAGGSGGGAIQLSAGKSITVIAGGLISVPGGGGTFGGSSAYNQEPGGGGSGGALLLEAPTVTIAGTLAANGGGGGQGNGDAGENGKATADPALGGRKGSDSFGGNGGAGDTPDGTDGTVGGGQPAGGGGGGAGRIRINTTTGTASVTGTVSPSAKTSCLSQGMLPK